MDKIIGFLLLTIVIFSTILSFGTLLLSHEKTAIIPDEIINVDAESYYYKFSFSNGTHITYDYLNFTNYNLTLYTNTMYLFNITNIDGNGHAMAFHNKTNGHVDFEFNIPALTTNSSYYDFYNFSVPVWYKITCQSSFLNNCGPNHTSMDFFIKVVSRPASSSGATQTITNFVPVTTTTTQTSNVTQTVNVTVPSTQTFTESVTQSLPSMTILFTVIALISLVPIYKHRK